MEQFHSMSSDEKRRVHFELCKQALAIWSDYIENKKKIKYTDSVVGLQHLVDLTLPFEAFSGAQQNRDGADIAKRYLEPITAMQDDDLVFPDHIKFAYYAIYNLFCKYAMEEQIDDWTIANQALSAHSDLTQIHSLLLGAMKSTSNQNV